MFLAKTLKIPKPLIAIAAGHTSRHKVLGIPQKIPLDEIETQLFEDRFPLFERS